MSLTVRDDGPVRIVAIDRPERRNAVDAATARDLHDAFTAFDAHESARVAVLTGSNSVFCAGYDLKSIADAGTLALPDGGENTPAPMGPTRLVLSKPVIAAIEGPAVAGGTELALWCDLRVMGDGAFLGIFCRRFGVPLVDGGTFRLADLIGTSRAMDLVLTGRPVDATEAERIGLANRVVPAGGALDAALGLAHEIARFPQACMRNDRMSMRRSRGLSHDAALREELRLGRQTLASGETVAGAGRFSGGEGRGGTFD